MIACTPTEICAVQIWLNRPRDTLMVVLSRTEVACLDARLNPPREDWTFAYLHRQLKAWLVQSSEEAVELKPGLDRYERMPSRA